MKLYGHDWVTDVRVALNEATIFCTYEELERIVSYLRDVQRYFREAEAEGSPCVPQHFFQYWKEFQQFKDTDILISKLGSRQSERE